MERQWNEFIAGVWLTFDCCGLWAALLCASDLRCNEFNEFLSASSLLPQLSSLKETSNAIECLFNKWSKGWWVELINGGAGVKTYNPLSRNLKSETLQWSEQLFIPLINQLIQPNKRKITFLFFNWISLIDKEMKWN